MQGDNKGVIRTSRPQWSEATRCLLVVYVSGRNTLALRLMLHLRDEMALLLTHHTVNFCVYPPSKPGRQDTLA